MGEALCRPSASRSTSGLFRLDTFSRSAFFSHHRLCDVEAPPGRAELRASRALPPFFPPSIIPSRPATDVHLPHAIPPPVIVTDPPSSLRRSCRRLQPRVVPAARPGCPSQGRRQTAPSQDGGRDVAPAGSEGGRGRPALRRRGQMLRGGGDGVRRAPRRGSRVRRAQRQR